MQKAKSRILKLISIFALCVAVICGAVFAFPNKNKDTDAMNVSTGTTTIGELLVDNYSTEKYKFEGNNLAILYEQLAGADANYYDVKDKVDAVAASSTTAMDKIVSAKTFYSRTKASQDIILTFGGMQWTAAALSKDNSGNVILTLLLANAFDSGKWNTYTSSSAATKGQYPANMYGTSYMRAVGLNNGGKYATSLTAYTTTATQSATHTLAKFTMTQAQGVTDSVVDFLTTPSEIKWQEVGHNKSSDKKMCVNDAWGVAESGWGYFSGYDYYSINTAGLAAWNHDYVWLPSQTEIQDWWGLSSNQKSAPAQYWTRSGGRGDPYSIRALDTKGASTSSQLKGNTTQAIRPAIHLNLTTAESLSNRAYTRDVTTVYDGQKQTLDSITKWFNENKTTATEKSGNFIDVGVHTVTLTLIDPELAFLNEPESVRSKDVTITITKKSLEMQAPLIDENGDLQSGAVIEPSDMLYSRDTGQPTAPDFALEYRKSGSSVWTTTKPTVAGNYFARPYITNPSTCNYEIDYTKNCESPFTKPKASVAVPYFTNSTLTANDIAGTVTTV